MLEGCALLVENKKAYTIGGKWWEMRKMKFLPENPQICRGPKNLSIKNVFWVIYITKYAFHFIRSPSCPPTYHINKACSDTIIIVSEAYKCILKNEKIMEQKSKVSILYNKCTRPSQPCIMTASFLQLGFVLEAPHRDVF